jgi:hypothetical protein
MARLQEPSVEDARLRVEEQLIRMKLREDKARAARSEQDQLRQVDAEKTARLRALRLARVAADDCSSGREKVTGARVLQDRNRRAIASERTMLVEPEKGAPFLRKE